MSSWSRRFNTWTMCQPNGVRNGLLISSIAEHAARNHGGREIVSVTADNPRHRYTFSDCIGRSKQLANALNKLGLEQEEE